MRRLSPNPKILLAVSSVWQSKTRNSTVEISYHSFGTGKRSTPNLSNPYDEPTIHTPRPATGRSFWHRRDPTILNAPVSCIKLAVPSTRFPPPFASPRGERRGSLSCTLRLCLMDLRCSIVMQQPVGRTCWVWQRYAAAQVRLVSYSCSTLPVPLVSSELIRSGAKRWANAVIVRLTLSIAHIICASPANESFTGL